MTNERTQDTAKFLETREGVSNRARRNILAVSAIGGNFLPLLLAAATYAQTGRTVDAQAFVTSPLPAKRTAAAEDDSIRPFHINIPEEQIVELRKRIAATRWPDKETISDESQSIRLAESGLCSDQWANSITCCDPGHRQSCSGGLRPH